MANTGTCFYCNKNFGKVAMKKHLEKCRISSEKNDSNEEMFFWILVQGYYQKEYWMYLDVSSNATLKDLDKFLRDKWLECCGHLSMFRIDEEIYESNPDPQPMFGFGRQGKSMKAKLSDVLVVGTEFVHEYDFGSSTVLKIKVVSSVSGQKSKEKVKLLAQNVAPVYSCSECGEPATQICSCCFDEDSFYCDECVENHECGEDMMLPIVNSPRMGVCGYCG